MSQRPDLDALDLLVRTGRHGSLSAAARELGLAQPNASRAITRLERTLGLTVLTRGPSGSRVTPEGALVVEWATDALAGVDRVVAGARSLVSSRQPHLRVAASLTIAEYLAPGWLSRFRHDFPTLRVSLAVGNSQDVLDRVQSGEIPLGFVETPTVPKGMSSVTVARDSLVVVVSPGHPWAGRRRPIAAADLATAPLVVRESGSGTHQTLLRALGKAGVEPGDAYLEMASNAAMKATAAAGDGAAVLSALAVSAELISGSLLQVPVEGLDLSRRLRAVWAGGVRLTGPAADLVSLASGRSRVDR